MIKTTSQPVKALEAKGISVSEIVKLGGRISKGGNASFHEGDPGFELVLQMFGIKFKASGCGCGKKKPLQPDFIEEEL